MGSTITDVTLTETAGELLSSSQLLSSSIGSLSSSRHSNSLVSKTCKHASNLFLTRRLPEALSTLEPILTAPRSADRALEDDEPPERAPIASASRSYRIKVWCLYLTLLNAILELGPEEGKSNFGIREWKDMVAKVRDGSIWEEIVQTGYGGIEGNVDAEVVINLATLLLSQSSSDTTNQRRLEFYLSASSQPNLDLNRHSNSSSRRNGYGNGHTSHDHGTNTPRDLNSRIKIIEIFTLHVLPRNEEWAYARDFISMSELLDEERRVTFLQTLQALEDEKSRDAEYDANEAGEQEVELQRQREQEEGRRLDEAQVAEATQQTHNLPSSHRKTDSETDYGIDSSHPIPTALPNPSKPIPKPPYQQSLPKGPTQQPRSPPGTTSPRKPTARTGLYRRTAATLSALQHLITQMAHSMSQNPMSLLRFVLFLMGIVIALSRRDVKERMRRVVGSGWEKLRGTVGMGVKVSYI